MCDVGFVAVLIHGPRFGHHQGAMDRHTGLGGLPHRLRGPCAGDLAGTEPGPVGGWPPCSGWRLVPLWAVTAGDSRSRGEGKKGLGPGLRRGLCGGTAVLGGANSLAVVAFTTRWVWDPFAAPSLPVVWLALLALSCRYLRAAMPGGARWSVAGRWLGAKGGGARLCWTAADLGVARRSGYRAAPVLDRHGNLPPGREIGPCAGLGPSGWAAFWLADASLDRPGCSGGLEVRPARAVGQRWGDGEAAIGQWWLGLCPPDRRRASRWGVSCPASSRGGARSRFSAASRVPTGRSSKPAATTPA